MKRILAILMAMVMVFSFAACGNKEVAEEQTSEVKIKETLTLARRADLDTPDPYGSTSSMAQTFSNHTHDPLVKNNPDTGELDAYLATEWKDVNGDGLVWEITLRNDVYFHNGDKFTADDVIFTWDYVAPSAGNVIKPLAAADYDEKIEKIDDTHIRFTLKNAMYDFPTYLEAKIYCKHAFETMDAAEAAKIGTGPYMWSDELNISGVQFGCTRNDNYWGGTEDLKSKNIVWKFIADDNTRQSALETGDVDMLAYEVTNLVSQVKDVPGIQLVSRQGANSYYLGFNYSVTECQNLDFRRAICQGIDKEAIATVMFVNGLGGAPNGNFCTSNGLGYTEIDELEYDPEATKAYFAENKPAKDKYVLAFYPSNKTGAEVIQASLAELGINIELRQVDSTQWTPFKAAQQEYDMFLDYCAYQGALLYNFNRFFYTGGSSNVYGYESAEYCAMQDKVSSAASYDEMLTEFGTLQQWVADNIPIFPWATNIALCVANENVQNITLAPTENYADYSRIYVLEK